MEKLISVLIPSRNRPQGLRELCDSLFNNANNPNQIEVIVYFDLDDSYIPEYVEYFNELTLKYTNPIKTIIGPKLVLSDYPNKLLQIASSDIFMNLGDDMRCKAKGWDEIIIEAINEYPDKINFVYVDDGYWGPNLASHHIIHRNYVECLGYFYPPFFDFGYSDAWMFQVA
jgi:glycosyltransferase involved in cell wall biosynthesis